ncbi:MAG TPA: DUF192 domain-containing protein [Paenalcaligenes sp.]|nr:DUF192 domain-containing protein [Paenalcaligenes sp.]
MTHLISGRLRPVFFAAALGLTTLTGPINSSADVLSDQQQMRGDDTYAHITLGLAAQSITVEVADNERTRSRGLMYRKSMPANHGMLFIFDYPHQPCFWMKNTYLPLSIAFITSQGTISSLHDMQPESTDTHCPREPILYALEMNQGWFKEHELKPGDKIKGLP